MNPSIATLIFVCGIAGLMYLDRQRMPRVSPALWIPAIWIAIVGSRSVSAWFELNPVNNAQLDGSPLDAAIYGALLALAVAVLLYRRVRTQALLLANTPILIYFLYCLVSVSWSDYPDISLKRWIKSVGDLAIVLIIATDQYPLEAIRRTVSRVGFVLLPTSVLLIMYFSDLGRAYNADGTLMNTGVTTNKNMLGLTVLMVSLVAVWNLRFLLSHKDQPNRSRRLVAQAVLLAFGILLFTVADSSTCIACFVLGVFLMIASGRPAVRERPGRVHSLVLSIVLLAGATVLWVGQSGITEALGRDESMSGRTVIWPAVIRAASNPIAGAGFESFWISPNVETFRQQLLDAGWYPPLVQVLNEAHNGYIETYLNLGWIGVFLVAAILISGYRKSIAVFRRDPGVGSFIFAVICVTAVYGIAEAGFRNLNPAWIFLLLVVVSASGVAGQLFAMGATETPAGTVLSGRLTGSKRDPRSLMLQESNAATETKARSQYVDARLRGRR